MILINLRVSPPLQFTFQERWSFHRFDPLGDLRIATKRCSEDSEISLVHSFNSNTIVTEKSEIYFFYFDYVCCLYDQLWWIGMVQDIDKEEDDVAVKCMHPNGPSWSLCFLYMVK